MTKRIPYLTSPLPALPAALAELQPARGTVPGRSSASARLIRKALILEFWPHIAGNPLQEQALVYCCNQHRTARWWVLHEDQASELIRAEMAQLAAACSCRGETGGGSPVMGFACVAGSVKKASTECTFRSRISSEGGDHDSDAS